MTEKDECAARATSPRTTENVADYRPRRNQTRIAPGSRFAHAW